MASIGLVSSCCLWFYLVGTSSLSLFPEHHVGPGGKELTRIQPIIIKLEENLYYRKQYFKVIETKSNHSNQITFTNRTLPWYLRLLMGTATHGQ